MSQLDYLLNRGSRPAPRFSSSFSSPRFRPRTGGSQPRRELTAPERFDVNKTFDDLSQSGAGIFATAAQLPSRVLENPVSIADTASRLFTGGRIRDGRATGGFSPVEAIGQTPLGAVGGALGEGIERVGNFVPALINSTDANIWKVVGDLPDSTEITDDLVRSRLEAMGESSLFAEGEKTEGVPILGALPFLRHVFGGRAKTVGELKEELAKRGFFYDEEAGTPLDPVDVARQLRSGRRSTQSFGFAATNDNALVDTVTRLTTDPSNAILFVPGANLAKIGSIGARILPTARLIRAGAVAERAARPVMAAEAILRGDRAAATLKGLGRALSTYRRAAIGTTAATFGLNTAANAITNLGGDDLPFVNEIREFTGAVQNNQPMSGNAAFMLFGAATFPYGAYAKNAMQASRAARARVFGVSDMAPFYREYGGKTKFHEEIGGALGEREVADFLDVQIARDLGLISPAEQASLQSIAGMSLRRKFEQHALQRIVDNARREGLITGDMRLAKWKEWHADQAGFRERGMSNPWALNGPQRAARRWRAFKPIREKIQPILDETGEVIWGLRDDVIFTEQTDLARQVLRAARYKDDAGRWRVRRQDILDVLEDNPNLNSLDTTGKWAQWSAGKVDPSWESVSRKISNQKRDSVRIDDYTAELAAWEAKAPPDIEPQTQTRSQRIAELKARQTQLGVDLGVVGDNSGFFTSSEVSHATFYARSDIRNEVGGRGTVYVADPPKKIADLTDDGVWSQLVERVRVVADQIEERVYGETGQYDAAYQPAGGSEVGRMRRVLARMDRETTQKGRDSVMREAALTIAQAEGKSRRGFDTGFYNEAVRDLGFDAVETIETNQTTGQPARVVIFSDTPRLRPIDEIVPGYWNLTPEQQAAEAARLESQGFLFHGADADPRPIGEGLAVQRELQALEAEEQAARAAKVAEADRKLGGDPTVGRRLNEAIESDDMIAPPRLSPGLDDLDPATVQRVADLEAEVIKINPSYRVKRAPTQDILALVPPDGAISTAIRHRRALGEWLFEAGPLSPLANLWHNLSRPVSRTELGRDAKQALMNELIPLGVKPEQVDRLLNRLHEHVKSTVTEDRAGFTARTTRDIGSIPPSAVNRIAAEVLNYGQRKGSEHKSLAAIRAKGDFYRLLAKAGSRFGRSLESKAAKGDKGAAALRTVYDIWNDSSLTKHLAAGQRKVARYYYPLFRFLADPRWIGLNLSEATILSAGKHGFVRAAKSLDDVSPAARRLALRDQGLDAPDVGLFFGRELDLHIAKGFDVQNPLSVEKVVDAMGDNSPVLSEIRSSMVREANLIERKAQRQFRAGEITQRQLDADTARAGRLRDGGNRAISEHLSDTINAYEQQGVPKTITDAARQILRDEELQVLRDSGMLDRLVQVQEQTWKDVQRMYHGNPDRSTLERLGNSYWLYWPLSYQIKATKWLTDIMLNGSFGMDNNALLAGKYALFQQEHEERMRNNPAYAAMYESHPSLWFTAQMLLPMSPEDIGVSMGRGTRLAGTHLQGFLNKWLGTKIGAFTAEKQSEDISSAIGWLTNMGPAYSIELAQRLINEADDVRVAPPQITQNRPTPSTGLPSLPVR